MHDFQSLYRLLGENSDTVTISARKASLDLTQPGTLPLGLGLLVGTDWVQLTRIPLQAGGTQRNILALMDLPASWRVSETAHYKKVDLVSLALSVESAFLTVPGLRQPNVVPFVDNSVVMEWVLADTCAEVGVNFSTGLYEFYATDFKLNIFEEQTYFHLEEALQRVVEFQAAAMMPRAKVAALDGDLTHQDLAVVHTGAVKSTYRKVGSEWVKL